MDDAFFCNLLATLFAWSLLSSSAAFAGSYRGARRYWKSFWLMTGIWGILDGAFGVSMLIAAPLDLGPLLRINAGLNGLYLAIGAILCTSPTPRWSGYGLAVVVQGLFLLSFNVYFWQKCEAAI